MHGEIIIKKKHVEGGGGVIKGGGVAKGQLTHHLDSGKCVTL